MAQGSPARHPCRPRSSPPSHATGRPRSSPPRRGATSPSATTTSLRCAPYNILRRASGSKGLVLVPLPHPLHHGCNRRSQASLLAPTAVAEANKRHRTAAAAAPMAATPAAAAAVDLSRVHPQRRHQEQQQQPLLPGLPDHLAQLCLVPLPPRLQHAVCRAWRRLLYASSFPPFLSLYAVLDGGADATGDGVSFAAHDAVPGRWDELPAPPMPSSSPPRLWHPSFLLRRLPLQSVASAGRLVLVVGSTHSLTPTLPRPVVFDPFAPRRWCAAGSACGRVFVASGIGEDYDANAARSGAVWDPASPATAWEPLSPMRDCRFSRDAAEVVCSGGKVCMVSLRRGRGAKEGAVFDLAAGRCGKCGSAWNAREHSWATRRSWRKQATGGAVAGREAARPRGRHGQAAGHSWKPGTRRKRGMRRAW